MTAASTSGVEATIAALASECDAQLAKAKVAAGSAFVAASGGEVRRSDTLVLTAPFTVWTRAKMP